MGPLDTDRLPCLAAQLPDPGTGSPVILGLTFLVGVKDMDKQSRVAIQLPGEGQWLEKGAAGLPSICLGKPEQSLADPPGEENGIGETPQLGPAPNKGMRETRDKWNTELEAGRGSIKRGLQESQILARTGKPSFPLDWYLWLFQMMATGGSREPPQPRKWTNQEQESTAGSD